MDGRLSLVNGRQVANLTQEDLPILARAITAAIRKRAGIGLALMEGVQMVQLTGVGFDLYVRSDDWLKIAPFLVDGTLTPSVGAPAVLFSDPPIDVSTIDLQDVDLYRRVYGTLQSLFTKKYPTSDI